MDGIKQNINGFSRMEGQGPLATGQSPLVNNKNFSDNLMMNQNSKDKANIKGINRVAQTSYGISHKRSVSDEIFNKIIPNKSSSNTVAQ